MSKMKIEHVALWVKNIKAMKDFYVTYFGAQASAKYVNEGKGFQSYFLSFSEGARLEIVARADVQARATCESDVTETAGPAKPGLGYAHLALSVRSAEAVDELTARLVADGYECLDGPRRTGDGYYESVVADPEGNRVEITV